MADVQAGRKLCDGDYADLTEDHRAVSCGGCDRTLRGGRHDGEPGDLPPPVFRWVKRGVRTIPLCKSCSFNGGS